MVPLICVPPGSKQNKQNRYITNSFLMTPIKAKRIMGSISYNFTSYYYWCQPTYSIFLVS